MTEEDKNNKKPRQVNIAFIKNFFSRTAKKDLKRIKDAYSSYYNPEGIQKNINSARNKMKTKHKFLYTILIATGAIFFWYGLLEILHNLPIFSNPVVSLIIGLIILGATGVSIYKVLV